MADGDSMQSLRQRQRQLWGRAGCDDAGRDRGAAQGCRSCACQYRKYRYTALAWAVGIRAVTLGLVTSAGDGTFAPAVVRSCNSE